MGFWLKPLAVFALAAGAAIKSPTTATANATRRSADALYGDLINLPPPDPESQYPRGLYQPVTVVSKHNCRRVSNASDPCAGGFRSGAAVERDRETAPGGWTGEHDVQPAIMASSRARRRSGSRPPFARLAGS